jgi:preprotein translocase subunit SecD
MRRKLLLPLVAILVVAFGGLAAALITSSEPTLGLDLQGGISVTQQPIGDYDPAALDLAVDRIRDRVDSLGVSEPEIIRQGDAIVVNLPGVENQQEAIDLVQVTGQVYLRPVMQCINEGVEETTQTTVPGSTVPESTVAGSTVPGDTTPASTPDDGTVPVVDTAVEETSSGSAGFRGQPPAGFRPRSANPPDTDSATTKPTTTEPTTTEPTTTNPTTTAAGAGTTVPAPPAPEATATAPETTVPVSDPNTEQILPLQGGGMCQVGPAGGRGDVFKNDATAGILQASWGVTVGLRDGSAGLDVWNQLASRCYSGDASCPSRRLAIELDGLIVSAPSVNQPSFTGEVQITGDFSEGDAKDLARVLRSGSLPLRMQTQSVQTVSPTLGSDSLRAAIIAGVIGVLLVLIFMLFYYRMLALVVFVGVTVSSALMYGLVTLLSETNGLTLSLAGIAGVIVSVGVTVDSYVVFFERLKDEVRSGRTMRNSAQRGFTGAWRTILMADLVSLIGATVLWYLTVGSVRNFAFFLGLSTLIDLVIAYCFTRPAVLLLARTKFMARRKVMGIEAVQAAAESWTGSGPRPTTAGGMA